jgi:putative transcriptional regulator
MPDGAEHVTGKVSLVPTGVLLEKTLAARPDPADFRVYLGYSGWARGQLENETGRGFWQVLNGSDEVVFDSEPETLWSRLIERTEQRIAQSKAPVVGETETGRQVPACAASPSFSTIFDFSSAGRPCHFAR